MRKIPSLALLLLSIIFDLGAQPLNPLYLRQTVHGSVIFDPNPSENFLKLKKAPKLIASSTSIQLIKYIIVPQYDTIFKPDIFITSYLDFSTYSAEGFVWHFGTIIPHFPETKETATFKKIKKNHFELKDYRYDNINFQEHLPHYLKLKYNRRGQLVKAKQRSTSIELKRKSTLIKKNRYKTTTKVWH